MNHKTAISLASLAVVLCALYAGYHLLGDDPVQETDDAYISADSVLVAPRVSGQISEVAVEDNQAVTAGQLLARLDDHDFRVEQAVAAANVDAAKAQLRNLQANIERQAALIDQASAAIKATAASLKFAESNAQRYQNLSKAGAGTQEERQKAESELLGWQAARERDQAAKVAAQRSLDVLKAERDSAEAAVAKAQATLQQADLNLSYTRINAPRDGMVGQRSVRVGAYVAAGKPLLAVVPLHEAYVLANFRETQLGHMHVGQAVDIRVDSVPDHSFKAHIDSVAPATGLSFSAIAPDNATGNFTKIAQRIPVKIVFDADQPDLQRVRVGLSVVARVDLREAH